MGFVVGGHVGGHSSSFDSHPSFGVHQEPFHGFHQPHFDHHDIHHDLHHDHHWSPWPVIGYASYRYGYSSGYSYDPYYDPYATPLVYTTPTVVVTQPQVISTDPAPVPDGYQPPSAEGAPEMLPGEGTNVRPRDGHAAPGLPPVLRVPLTETEEAPEVLPALPPPRGTTQPPAAPPATSTPTPR